MNIDTASNIRILLQSCDLKGSQVPVFVQCMQALQAIIEPPKKAPQTKTSEKEKTDVVMGGGSR
jgi:hypothetical protein